MNIVVHTAPASEPITAAEVMSFLRLDDANKEPSPGAMTAALASSAAAGNVDNGVHRYKATFVTADGETQAGLASAAIAVANKAVNGQVSLTAIPLGGSMVTARKLYRTAAGGSTYYLLATISNNTTTTYTDNIADSALGAEAPVTNTTADPLINMMIAAARKHAEHYLRRWLITQTLDAYLDFFPRYCNPRYPDPVINMPPLQSVTEITYVDVNGATQTLATDQYDVDAISGLSRIMPAYNVSWPDTRKIMNAVKIRFVAGYGDASVVPQCIKHWMLVRIGTMWEVKQEFIAGLSFGELPPHFIDSLLSSEKIEGRT